MTEDRCRIPPDSFTPAAAQTLVGGGAGRVTGILVYPPRGQNVVLARRIG